MTRRAFPVWTLLGVVLVVALVVGSGVFSSAPPTAAQRAVAIESGLRCPSCEDLSVADSSAPTAVTVRNAVRQMVGEGKTDQQIDDYLVARYGASIVLDPPASGWTLLVWLLPLLGGAVIVAVVVTLVVRRRRSSDLDPVDDAGTLDATAVAERARFLSQSLADVDAEYLAGDLSDKDYLALRRRDMTRLAALGVRAGDLQTVGATVGTGVMVDDQPPAPPPAPTAAGSTAAPRRRFSVRPRRNTWFLIGAVAAFGAALLLAVTLFASNRLPGQTATGSITLSPSQRTEENLAQAATYQNEGQLTQAAQLYQAVLAAHPDNEVALAQLGWLEFESGRQEGNRSLINDGQTKLNRAVRLDPGDYAVRLYLGTVALQQDGDPTAAVAQYRLFLADGPPAALVTQAAGEIRQAYGLAGLPVPAQVATG
jgi:cytochrome c-type biogenesis protein CcmH